MSQGTVRVTPKPPPPAAKGALELTVVDPPNTFNLKAGDALLFIAPSFAVNVGDRVDCNITSATECTITGIRI